MPHHNPRKRLLELLLRVPSSHSAEGRNSMLMGVPNALFLNRNSANAADDLSGIITQLEALGPLKGAQPWPLVIVAENAQDRVRGTRLEDELDEVIRLLEQGDESASAGTPLPSQPRSQSGNNVVITNSNIMGGVAGGSIIHHHPPSAIQTPPPTAQPFLPPLGLGGTLINPIDNSEMVFIPAGHFIMGSDQGEPDARPQRKVYLDSYWISKTPVTVAQYQYFSSLTGRRMPTGPDWGWMDDHPMVNVSWDDAAAYSRWAGVLLPTEAQWEKAARGTDRLVFPWGNQWDAARLHTSKSWGDDAKRTAAVESFQAGASPYGCLHMAGNVWDWCADWFDSQYYRKGENDNPAGPASGDERVIRGGSWRDDNPIVHQSHHRGKQPPGERFRNVGFRCAASP